MLGSVPGALTVVGLLAAATFGVAPPPAVLLIRSGKTPEARQHERRLFDALSASLDEFMLLSEQAPDPAFDELPLAKQIAAALPEAKRNDAAVILWMSFPLAHQVMLHLVALGSGRAFIRTIETDRSPLSESSLALMARELLGTAYLFEPAASLPAELSRVVQTVRSQMPTAPPAAAVPAPVPQEPAASPWAISLKIQAPYPLAGGADAVPAIHGAVAVERELAADLELSFGAEARHGVVDRPGVPGAWFFLAGPVVLARWNLRWGRMALGPYGAAALDYGLFEVSGASTSRALGRFEFGVHGRGQVAPHLELGIQVGVGFWPERPELDVSIAQPAYRFPTAELLVGVSVAWRGL